MSTSRLEAFSDGVLAIIITIMVLEMKVPEGTSWSALRPLAPVFASYVMSFIYLGIYWNNHHHLLRITEHIHGWVLWANLHLLFWLSLIPFVTGWMGENHFAPMPAALYGGVLLAAAVAWMILEAALLASPDCNVQLRAAVGRDWKAKISALLYLVGIGLSLWVPWLGIACYVVVAFMWLTPDRRFEARIRGG